MNAELPKAKLYTIVTFKQGEALFVNKDFTLSKVGTRRSFVKKELWTDALLITEKSFPKLLKSWERYSKSKLGQGTKLVPIL